MGIFDRLRQEFIDIIEWEDNTNDTLVWKFPRYNNEIKMNAKLIVRESQQAVFLNEGTIADVFMPGTHTLHTQNMPILATLKGWKYGFESPFKADVFFVSTRQFVDQRWGTKNAITIHDSRFGMIELRSFGTFAYRVTDAAKFIREISGTDSNYTVDEINGQLRSLIVNKFSSAVGTGVIPVDKLAGSLEDLSSMCQERLNADFEAYGLRITRFIIENVSMPDGLKEEIFEYSRLHKIDVQQLASLKTAKSIEIAADNPGGIAGIGIGLGTGLGIGNAIAGTVGSVVGSFSGQGTRQDSPPPIPGAAEYYIAIAGKQAGPFGAGELAAHVQAGTLQRNTLVWKAGMSEWEEAGTVSDLDTLFVNTPPPLPQ